MIWFVILLYVGIVVLCIGCLWVSYQVKIRGRLTLIRDSRNQPLANAQLIASHFSVLAGSAGVVVLMFGVAIPAYHIRWGTWHFHLGFVAGIWGAWRQVLLMRHAKLAASNQQSTEMQTSVPPLP